MTDSLPGAEPSSGATMVPRRKSRRITVLLPLIGLIAVAICGLALFGLATAEVGVLGVMIGVTAALLPVAVVIATFLWIDRWEPEPPRLLLLGFAWGACIAAATALLLNNTAEGIGDLLIGNGNGEWFSAVVSAPLVEEAAKAAFVVLVLWWRSADFNGIVDGIVYAGFSAAGFAFTENIYYFGRAFAEYGFGSATSSGVVAAFVLRGVLAPFTHPLFAVLTGMGLGVAARTKSKKLRVLAPVGGFIAAVCLHSLWNAAATLGGAAFFIDVYFLIMVPIFIAVLLLVLWHRRREQRILSTMLPVMAAKRWIAASEVTLLANLADRRRWCRQVRKQSGRAAARAVSTYQASVTELAFLRASIQAGSARGNPDQHHADLLEVVRTSRLEAKRLAV